MTLEYFFFDLPINTPITLSESDMSSFKPLFHWMSSSDIEGYNPVRKKHSTFSINQKFQYTDIGKLSNDGFAEIQIKCKRYSDIFRFHCQWNPEERILVKYGQQPTVADFHIYEINQYRKLLTEEKLREFTKAIGLAANGVGIGSFVYLRRVFEHLINDAYQIAESNKSVDFGTFKKSRMDEKIKLLADFLPEFLVKNKGIYSILSLGVHELNEITCLENFDTMRVGIEIILDEKLEELRKKEKIHNAQKKIDILRSTLKK